MTPRLYFPLCYKIKLLCYINKLLQNTGVVFLIILEVLKASQNFMMKEACETLQTVKVIITYCLKNLQITF